MHEALITQSARIVLAIKQNVFLKIIWPVKELLQHVIS